VILPSERRARYALYRNLIRYCERSRSERRARARRLRDFYLTGSDEGADVFYNKIEEWVEFSSAYLYDPASVRFYPALPPHYGNRYAEELAVAREELEWLWHQTPTALLFAAGVTWAHVWDSVVFKVVMQPRSVPMPWLVPDPSDLGVLHENLNDWENQEAICQWYVMDLARFERLVNLFPAERVDQRGRDELIQLARDHAVPGYETSYEMLPPAVSRLIISAASPTMTGAVDMPPEAPLGIPRVSDPVVRIAELWVKDDSINDYRVVTNFLPTEDILWEPENPLLKGQHPFHELSLSFIPGYLWGKAPAQSLLRLQLLREKKFHEQDRRDELFINPPLFFEGMSNLDGEKSKRFRLPGGDITSSMPNAKVTPVTPPPKVDEFGFIDQVDNMFARQSALPKVNIGGMEAGVRTEDQLMALAMLGSGPTMRRAMIVKSAAERLATYMLRLHRQVLGRTLKTHEGAEFYLSQISGEIAARVWANSTSPLYVQQTFQKATAAKQLGAIDNESYLDYLDLPNINVLKRRAREMGEGQAAAAQQLVDIKKAEAEAKMVSASARARKIS